MYRHSTQKNHSHILHKHLLPRFGDNAICEVTRQDIQAYVAELCRKNYAPKTIDHIHDVLSAIMRTAMKVQSTRQRPPLSSQADTTGRSEPQPVPALRPTLV